MRELSRRAFPEPDAVSQGAPAPIEVAIVLRRGQERGQLDRDVDTDAVAHLLFYGTAMWREDGRHTVSPETAQRLVRAVHLPRPAPPAPLA